MAPPKESATVRPENPRVFYVGNAYEAYGSTATIFRRKGYRISTDSPDKTNPFGLGLYTDNKIDQRKEAQELGIRMPDRFQTPDAILDTPFPLIAKATHQHVGKNKILLTTYEDKVRFIAAKFVNWNSILTPHYMRFKNRKELDVRIEGVLQKIRERNFDDPIFQKEPIDIPLTPGQIRMNALGKMLRMKKDIFTPKRLEPSQKRMEDFAVEEFIEVPGDRRASFRLLVDGYGHIQYGLLYYSRYTKKKEKKLLAIERVRDFWRSLRDDVSGNPQPKSSVREEDPYRAFLKKRDPVNLLINPSSQLFINTPDMTSNLAPGGIVRLNGKKVRSKVKRNLLHAYGIDPNNPQIPSQLFKPSQQLGKRYQYQLPLIGIDFIQSETNREYYFLEVNNPGIGKGQLGYFPLGKFWHPRGYLYKKIAETKQP